ncbi:MAG: azurin [Bacteroidota bacterium]
MKNYMLLMVLALFLASCGGSETSESTSDAPVQEEPVAEVPSEPAGEVSLEINGSDQMQYDISELKVSENYMVTLTLNHTGQLPKQSMGHNFVLLKEGTDVAEFAVNAIAAMETDYIPAGDNVIAHTKMLGGGESDTITFMAPPKGTYDFICSFPGHYGIMKGKFIVM